MGIGIDVQYSITSTHYKQNIM